MSQLDETLGGLRVIKAFIAESKMSARFSKTNNDFRDEMCIRDSYIGKNAVKKEDVPKQLPENFDMNCLAVDAACSGNPGPME